MEICAVQINRFIAVVECRREREGCGKINYNIFISCGKPKETINVCRYMPERGSETEVNIFTTLFMGNVLLI